MTIGSPLDIPDLRWYSADHLASLGMTDGQVITTWSDLSPDGDDMTLTGGPTGPVFRTAGGPAGGPSVQFPGGSSGYFTLPNLFLVSGVVGVGVASGELYCHVKSEHDGTDPYPGPWMMGDNHPAAGDVCHYPFSPSGATVVYEHFGFQQAGTRPNGAAPVSLTAWRRVNLWRASNDWRMRFDEDAVTPAAWQTHTTDPNVRWSQNPLVGCNFPGTGQRARMRLGGFYLCPRKLTTGERADLAAWAAANPSGGLLAVPPGDPDGPVVSAASAHSLTLTWSAPLAGGTVTSYDVRIDGGTPVPVGVLAFNHTFTGLEPLTTYALEVRSVGPGGESAWVGVSGDTTAPPPPGWYRVELELADDGVFESPSHSWSVERGDSPDTWGPMLPLSLGWDIPDQVDYFPAAAGPTVLSVRVLVENATDLATLTQGVTTVHCRVYVDDEPDADPWQDFTGILTQVDGEAVSLADDTAAFRATLYAADDTMRLHYVPVGYDNDWPEESIADRIDRIALEAGRPVVVHNEGGLEGTLAARPKGPTTAMAAFRDALKDAASDNTSTPPFEWYGRYVLAYDLPTSTIHVWPFERRVYPDSTLVLDGTDFLATGTWSKLPGPAANTWAIVDGVTFGTPDGRPPIVVRTSLVDTTPSNPSAQTRDNLGESLLPDGSTMLDGWYSRSLRYLAHQEGAAELVDHLASLAPCRQVLPVVVTPLNTALEVNGDDYIAGTLIGARMVIPPGGDYYVDLTLRPEILTGTDLP